MATAGWPGPGPVFAQEWLTASRRWQGYALRSLLVLLLLLGLSGVWLGSHDGAGELPVRQDRHRGYHDSDPGYRDKESAKTYNRFLQTYRGRKELLAKRS